MIQPAPTPPAIVTTCRVAEDPAGREWSLAREGPSDSPRWVLLFRRGAAASAPVRLPLPSAAPTVSAERVELDFHSANGGRSVTLSAGAAGPSRLDVFVNFELEVNVERDLDRAVDAMNTEGPITVTCTFAAPPGPPRQDEWMAGVGAAWSIDLLQSAGGRRVRAGQRVVGPGRDARCGAGHASRPVDVGGGGDAAVLADAADDTAGGRLSRRWCGAGGSCPRARAAAVRGTGIRRTVHRPNPFPKAPKPPTSSRTAAFGVRWRPASAHFVGHRLSLSAHLERESAHHQPRGQRARALGGLSRSAPARLADAASCPRLSVIFVLVHAAHPAARRPTSRRRASCVIAGRAATSCACSMTAR